MDLARHRATEDQFLGSLLGMAIGDALGRPLRGMTEGDIRRQYGAVTGYIRAADVSGDQPPGEITDKSEVVLAIVESLTTNDGLIDSVNINARLSFLVRGPSRVLMSEAVISGVQTAMDTDGLVPVDLASEPEIAVALRGVPIGLLHAVGGFDDGTLLREAAEVSRLSHGGNTQRDLTTTVARAVCAAARFGDDVELWDEVLVTPVATPAAAMSRVGEIVTNVKASHAFEDSVLDAAAKGGEADANGALAGAIAGARFGASGIPQELIDGLDARIYISLAAPWFFRTALRRAGTVIDLRLIE
jgi:ADP-ribosyl-[dinitrogen reductase] hydrolase